LRKCVRPDEPHVLKENASKWNAQWENLKRSNPSASFAWYQSGSVAVNQLIRDDLSKMTQGHCAFCDVNRLEPESVEHFQPKSDARFYQLAYAWSNLFLCCGGCQLHKREQWDERLLRPDAADYRFEQYFQFDYTTGGISPSDVATPDDQARAAITIQFYGLDSPKRRRYRREELRRWLAAKYAMDIDDFAYRDYLDRDCPPATAV
jgi:uncharacterized protein (TIGR02646 family)